MSASVPPAAVVMTNFLVWHSSNLSEWSCVVRTGVEIEPIRFYSEVGYLFLGI